MTSSHAVRRLLELLYLAGILVLADQAADLVATVLAKPLAPSQASWRFGAFGLLMTRASVFLIADVMLFTAAVALGHRKVLRVLGALHGFVALALLAGLLLFSLDWLQIRRDVSQAGTRTFDLAGLRAAGLALLTSALAGWAALAALRATRSRGRSASREGDAAPLLTAIRRDEEGS